MLQLNVKKTFTHNIILTLKKLCNTDIALQCQILELIWKQLSISL